MAHVKAQGSSTNGRDSNGQRLGIKIYGDQKASAGAIIVRQRGTKYHPGVNTGMGKDNTIFAKAAGTVKFIRKSDDKCYVNIERLKT